MSKTTKIVAALVLFVSAAAIAGGNPSQVIAAGIVGATAGALIPA